MSILELNRKARKSLAYSYKKPVAAEFIFNMLYGICGVFILLHLFCLLGLAFNDSGDPTTDIECMAYIFLTAGIAATILAGNPLRVGHNSFYIAAAKNRVYISSLFDGFRYQYINNLRIMFLYDLCMGLWALFAGSVTALSMSISPVIGCVAALPVSAAVIIQMQQYFMIGYIIADNPSIGARRAFEISKEATSGYKLKIALAQLPPLLCMSLPAAGAFIINICSSGEMIFAALLVYCAGMYFIMPYFYAVRAQCYLFLKEKAIENGIASQTKLKKHIF